MIEESATTTKISDRHAIFRVEHESIRRRIKVVSIEELTPLMRRLEFQAESLKTFTRLGYDDHVKVFFPVTTSAGETAFIGRDFTPRRADRERGLLTIDFALHDTGMATTWARQVRLGDSIEVGGPRSSRVVTDDFDWYLLLGDESALPAIGRRLEELRPGVRVTTIVALASEDEQQPIRTAAAWNSVWLSRGASGQTDEVAIRNALQKIEFPPGDGFIWLAGESRAIRSLRSYLVDDRGFPAEWIRASGYWKRGEPGAHERIDGPKSQRKFAGPMR
jgi:NADPH-dependent ferric siderophore reductase